MSKPYDIKSGYAFILDGKIYQFPTETEAEEYIKEMERDNDDN